ncbi:MAG TPA: hypothetical protein PKZ22_15780 [Accumulibacter sp.]|nr:hypothetical protein [Accumulibacter sp.]
MSKIAAALRFAVQWAQVDFPSAEWRQKPAVICFTIIVPAYNEQGSVIFLIEEILATQKTPSRAFESMHLLRLSGPAFLHRLSFAWHKPVGRHGVT